MCTNRPFTCFDLLKYGNINLDMYTETYSIKFYLHYLAKWPEYMRVLESPVLACFQVNSTSETNIPKEDISTANESKITTNSFLTNFSNQSPTCGRLMGYMMAKSEGHNTDWHGHVTALSVAPEYRRLGLATQLMMELEDTSERKRCYFIDLFVRASNKLGLEIYTKLGFIIYRRILNYYWGAVEDEDAFDMRKALSTDINKLSVIPITKPVRPEELEYP